MSGFACGHLLQQGHLPFRCKESVYKSTVTRFRPGSATQRFGIGLLYFLSHIIPDDPHRQLVESWQIVSAHYLEDQPVDGMVTQGALGKIRDRNLVVIPVFGREPFSPLQVTR